MYVLEPNTSECLHYEPVLGYPPASHVTVPREILAEHPEVEIRNDFIDCSIDVCSVEVGASSFFTPGSELPHTCRDTEGPPVPVSGAVAVPGQLRLIGHPSRLCARGPHLRSTHEKHSLLRGEGRVRCPREGYQELRGCQVRSRPLQHATEV